MKFSDAIDVISNVMAVEPSPAFVAKLRNYQKTGLWPDTRTGKGHAGEYSLDTVFQICVSLTLVEAGMLPLAVETMVREHRLWDKVDEAVRNDGQIEVFAGALAPYGGTKPYVRVVQPEHEIIGVAIWPAGIAEAVAAYFKLVCTA